MKSLPTSVSTGSILEKGGVGIFFLKKQTQQHTQRQVEWAQYNNKYNDDNTPRQSPQPENECKVHPFKLAAAIPVDAKKRKEGV